MEELNQAPDAQSVPSLGLELLQLVSAQFVNSEGTFGATMLRSKVLIVVTIFLPILEQDRSYLDRLIVLEAVGLDVEGVEVSYILLFLLQDGSILRCRLLLSLFLLKFRSLARAQAVNLAWLQSGVHEDVIVHL